MMRHFLIALLAVFLFLGCKPKKVKVATVDGPAQIEFVNDERVYDFGTISRKDSKMNHAFRFINKGSEPLVIHSVTTSCHCVTVDYPKSPVRPGSEGVINIKLDMTSQPDGYIKRSAYIYNNSSNRPEVRLVFEGIIED